MKSPRVSTAMHRTAFWVAAGLAAWWTAGVAGGTPAGTATAATAPLPPSIAAFSTAPVGAPPAPWRVVGLPGGRVPLARLDVAADGGGHQALRMATQAGYGTLVHPLAGYQPLPSDMLAWRWRLDEPVAGADLRTRQGDDNALKLCLMFDLPLEALGFLERNLMRLARAATSEPLPAATLCYVWDPTLPGGTLLPNAHSRRVRFLVLDGADTPHGASAHWRTHSRPIVADFLRAFGDETRQVPPVVAVVVGADSDNTGASSLAWVGDVRIQR